MDFDGIVARMREGLGQAVTGAQEAWVPEPGSKEKKTGPRDPVVHVRPEDLVQVCTFLRDDPELRFDLFLWMTALDYPDPKDEEAGGRLELVYHFLSTIKNHRLTLKADVPRLGGTRARVASVTGVYAAAGWHERETYDFFGIRFEGHPDLRRILCPEDWDGHPLLKDYAFPKEYRGISAE